MTLRNIRILGPYEKLPMQIRAGGGNRKRLVHIGVHNSANRNAGDTLLFPVVRKAFDVVLGPFDWDLVQAWEEFTPATAQRINSDADGIVLGGGGLLLRDQAGSDVSNSGWQWNAPVSAVEAIDIPLVIFAIGYNRFRGQPDFDPVFHQHIREVVAKAGFVGLRNSGSIRALAGYLPEALAGKLVRQFCPTTVLWQLYPEFREMAIAHDKKQARVLAFNAAFDRATLRFGENVESVLRNVAAAVRCAEARGWRILSVAHKTMDRDIGSYLDAVGVTYDVVDLTDAGPEEIIAFYAEIDLALGMRGHAQMIPFGLRRPIVSLISHDKMRYFLEDIGQPQWGVEVAAPDLSDRLAEVLQRLESDRERCLAEVAAAQEVAWNETFANLGSIGRTFLKSEQ